MKIAGMRTFLLRKPLDRPLVTSRGEFRVRTHLLVQVETDAGITGLGEGMGNGALIKTLVEGPMRERALGLDPFNIALLYRRLVESDILWEQKGSALSAASAIELACWDIKGKALGQPVHQLLGGLVRDRVEAYASDLFWDSPDEMARLAARYVEGGFRLVKCHIGRLPPAAETPRVRAMRKAIGPEAGLMIDVNCGYDFDTALEAAQRWGSEGVFWFEEPLSPYQVDALARLRQAIPIPIATGENEFTVHGFKPLFDRGAVDYAMPDIGRAGGLWEVQRICTLAATYGLAVSPHNFGSGVLLAATLHLMASTPNTKLLEYDVAGTSVAEELLVEPLRVEDGHVPVPTAPGLGVHLPEAVLARYA